MKRAEKKYEFCTERGLDAVNSEVEKIIDYVDGYLHETELFGLRLVVTEMMNNAIIHGNKNDFGNVSGTVVLDLKKQEIQITIADEGEGFEWTKLLIEKSISPDPGETLSANGRGYMLVRMYGFTYSFNASGNEVELIKEVKLKNE